MATVTGLGAVYFFFAFFVGIFRLLKWKNGIHGTGTAVSVSGPEYAGRWNAYVYDIVIEGEDPNSRHIFKEKTEKKQQPKTKLNEPMEIVYIKTSQPVILASEYDRLKKGLYVNPIGFVVCVAITVGLILLSASL